MEIDLHGYNQRQIVKTNTLANIVQPLFSFLPAHIAEASAHSIAVAIAFTAITAVHIIFGELVPKWVALERAETTAMWVVKPTELFMRALWPFNVNRRCPSVASHTAVVLSALLVATRRPSGEKATECIAPLCPFRTNRNLPLTASHNLAV